MNILDPNIIKSKPKKGYSSKFKGSDDMEGQESYICKRAVEAFGKDTQILMYFEEAGELAQAISKDKRGFKDKANIAEEIADVEIMLEQLKYIYKCHHAAEQFKAKKLIRLSARGRELLAPTLSRCTFSLKHLKINPFKCKSRSKVKIKPPL